MCVELKKTLSAVHRVETQQFDENIRKFENKKSERQKATQILEQTDRPKCATPWAYNLAA